MPTTLAGDVDQRAARDAGRRAHVGVDRPARARSRAADADGAANRPDHAQRRRPLAVERARHADDQVAQSGHRRGAGERARRRARARAAARGHGYRRARPRSASNVRSSLVRTRTSSASITWWMPMASSAPMIVARDRPAAAAAAPRASRSPVRATRRRNLVGQRGESRRVRRHASTIATGSSAWISRSAGDRTGREGPMKPPGALKRPAVSLEP